MRGRLLKERPSCKICRAAGPRWGGVTRVTPKAKREEGVRIGKDNFTSNVIILEYSQKRVKPPPQGEKAEGGHRGKRDMKKERMKDLIVNLAHSQEGFRPRKE